MRLPEEIDDVPLQINIVPMIDVIFAILTFFIMSSLFLSRSEGLPVILPKAIMGNVQQQSIPLVVTVDKYGSLALNRQPVKLNEVSTRVRALIPLQQREVVVLINADKSVSHGVVTGVMDELRSVSGVKIAIGTVR
ncbi:MAG: biopolymer transporter ExbD [Oscillatoriales cyanobacterium]|uniref:Biopolymer transporter ExbD n=1 Tax=Microcoleus anatoxicus PTRS2 TaxID=2705321 RepID=A0ABU8YLX0_9CYAN|nr:MAG: biopolymer transporter ExbD [Oscillatoriales cyanobacterium]TAD95617.1 MAG: biopolymer transporter ExbD [Oscillatoriales cyanobacterium]TAE01910.1 MAG: biopolymer transporter ExbD [Oscillatoriales cyanobacterium]TAF00910.1 MAG: biopolymer transporter ExbD [Oscillatoriales cyanobacterium]TAF44187.1 MAG: biopolymer transporter ExbD [Oscillatoriales cyanobacterium]